MIALLAVAQAAPTFTGTRDDVAFAQLAWNLAIACTGVEPEAHATIPITRDLKSPWAAGMATSDAKGMLKIELLPDASPHTFAHEIAHAWSHEGPHFIVEGRTEVIARCIADNLPKGTRYYEGDAKELDALPDVRTVTDMNALSDRAREQVYIAATRWFTAVAEKVPMKTLLAVKTWEQLDALPVDAPTTKDALQDVDRDGISGLQERLTGTDPNKWDTDGDGWWDGGEKHPADAVPLPIDGTPICFTSKTREKAVFVEWGGNLRGIDLQARSAIMRGDKQVIMRMGPELRSKAGGTWVRIDGTHEADDCAYDPRFTVVGAGAAAFGEALRPLLDTRFPDQLQRTRRRMHIKLVDSKPRVVTHPSEFWTVELPPDTDPILAVAMHEMGGRERYLRRPDVMAAYYAFLAGKDHREPALLDGLYAADVKRALKWVAKCESGWNGILQGDCRDTLPKQRL